MAPFYLVIQLIISVACWVRTLSRIMLGHLLYLFLDLDKTSTQNNINNTVGCSTVWTDYLQQSSSGVSVTKGDKTKARNFFPRATHGDYGKVSITLPLFGQWELTLPRFQVDQKPPSQSGTPGMLRDRLELL